MGKGRRRRGRGRRDGSEGERGRGRARRGMRFVLGMRFVFDEWKDDRAIDRK